MGVIVTFFNNSGLITARLGILQDEEWTWGRCTERDKSMVVITDRGHRSKQEHCARTSS